jgi:hypothetical protein
MKLSNNLAAIASRRLQMRKRTWDDEYLPLLQASDVHLYQHTAGASDTMGTSEIAYASNIMDASNAAGANAFLATVTF